MKYLAVIISAVMIYVPISLVIVLTIYALILAIKALKIYIGKNS